MKSLRCKRLSWIPQQKKKTKQMCGSHINRNNEYLSYLIVFVNCSFHLNISFITKCIKIVWLCFHLSGIFLEMCFINFLRIINVRTFYCIVLPFKIPNDHFTQCSSANFSIYSLRRNVWSSDVRKRLNFR